MKSAPASDFPGMHVESTPSWMGGGAKSAPEVSTGTTLVAVEFADGVVIGADTRTSMGTFVHNRYTDKLTRLSDHIYCQRSGSAADTQAIADIMKYKMDIMKIEFGKPVAVHTAAYMFQKVCYEYRDQLSAGIIVAGWDQEKGGQVYSIPLGGMMVRQPASIGGSGSTYLYGYLDSRYRLGMTKDECVDLVLNCVTHAINRDGSSGGCCRYVLPIVNHN